MLYCSGAKNTQELYVKHTYKISFCFKYISGSRWGSKPTPPTWHDVGARNALVTRGLIVDISFSMYSSSVEQILATWQHFRH